ncbi:pyridoxal kinase PdxY [Spirochaetia bacterium]|nr:pyridoxal kinase PdxY [Spirochaetia bacterium]
MAILSIQSHVVYGYAGNSSAVFPLQRMGNEVWAVNTVEFSNHTGYGAWRGSILGAELARELLTGLMERGVMPQCEAVLSGYLGTADIGHSILEAVRKVRAANPNAIYCCDPVIGDLGRGVYVHEGISDVFKNDLLPEAAIVTPNQFELELLTGIAASSTGGAKDAIKEMHKIGAKVVLVTSYLAKDRAPDTIGMLASDGSDIWSISTPELKFNAVLAGSGDLCAAIFLSRYLQTRDVKKTLELTAGSVFGIMKATFDADSRELYTIQAQNELIKPSCEFNAARF